MATAKTAKIYTIKSTRYRSHFGDYKEDTHQGTLEELKEAFSYTLECGESYEHERGNYKINTNPKTISSLVSMLNKAEHNRAADGCASCSYELVG